MSEPPDQSRFGPFLALGAMFGMLLVGIESETIKDMSPQRALMVSASLSWSKGNAARRNISAMTKKLSFALPTPCSLPLPAPTNTEDDNESKGVTSYQSEVLTNQDKCVLFFPERFFASVATDFQQPSMSPSKSKRNTLSFIWLLNKKNPFLRLDQEMKQIAIDSCIHRPLLTFMFANAVGPPCFDPYHPERWECHTYQTITIDEW